MGINVGSASIDTCEDNKANKVEALLIAHGAASLIADARTTGLSQATHAIDVLAEADLSFVMAVDLIGFSLRRLYGGCGVPALSAGEMRQHRPQSATARHDAILWTDSPARGTSSTSADDHRRQPVA